METAFPYYLDKKPLGTQHGMGRMTLRPPIRTMAKSNSDREILYDPDLGPEYEKRFDALTDELVEYPKEVDREVAIKDEIQTIEKNLSEDQLSPDPIRYLATLEVLLDLVEIGFEVRKNSNFKVVRPDPDKKANPKKYKQQERDILKKERITQFNEKSVREFIQRMEGDHPNNDHTSVEKLIASGEGLYNDLAVLQDRPREEVVDHIDPLIRPYVQVASKGEKCGHTGLDLMDIWRYFRYTWLTPYNTVPGRNINLLIRDSARPNDPIMGIASIASPMMNLTVRDEHIGWKIEALEERLKQRVRVHEFEVQLPKEKRSYPGETKPEREIEELETEEEWKERIEQVCANTRRALESALRTNIENVKYDDFIQESPLLTEEKLKHPDQQVFDILAWLEKDAEQTIKNDEDVNPENLDSWEARSKTALFRKKRARTLQKLLRDKQYFEEHADQSDTKFIQQGLKDEKGRRAIKTAMKETKKRRAGAGMMNIMVCGAIPPYNELVGGKLVGMALTGPEVIDIYRDKYKNTVSNIASSMKGEPVVKDNEVVFYDTTSLFEVGSAQYDRIRVPATNGQIEYEELGYTQGYGSIQFGPMTRKRLSQVTEFEEGRQVVHGRFGEGVAPRMRKIRRGLENCGMDGNLLKHESRRIVYGVDLAENAKAYLRGETDYPNYYWSFNDVEQEQQSIYDHWKERWASKRVQKQEILNRIKEFDREDVLLGTEIKYAQRQLSDFLVGNN